MTIYLALLDFKWRKNLCRNAWGRYSLAILDGRRPPILCWARKIRLEWSVPTNLRQHWTGKMMVTSKLVPIWSITKPEAPRDTVVLHHRGAMDLNSLNFRSVLIPFHVIDRFSFCCAITTLEESLSFKET